MKVELTIDNVFEFSNGTHVVTCENESDLGSIAGKSALLVLDGRIVQETKILRQHFPLNPQRKGLIAIETSEKLALSRANAESGRFTLVIL